MKPGAPRKLHAVHELMAERKCSYHTAYMLWCRRQKRLRPKPGEDDPMVLDYMRQDPRLKYSEAELLRNADLLRKRLDEEKTPTEIELNENAIVVARRELRAARLEGDIEWINLAGEKLREACEAAGVPFSSRPEPAPEPPPAKEEPQDSGD